MANEVLNVDGTAVKTTYDPSAQDRHHSDRARCWYEQVAGSLEALLVGPRSSSTLPVAP